MSITLWFEADANLPEDVLVALLGEAGAVQLELESGLIIFSFPSGLSAYPRGAEGDLLIKAEDPQGLSFAVGSRCTFSPVNQEYDWCMKDLQHFLERVVDKTGAHFVVSFQLEQTLFLNAGYGLKNL